MKKKISLLLCILMSVFCFVGCSGKMDAEDTTDSAKMEQIAEVIIYNFTTLTDEQLESLKSSSEFYIDYTMMQGGLPINSEDFSAMIDSWQSAEDECGEYESHGDYKVEYKSDGVVLTTAAKYKERNADIAFSFDKSGNLKSMDVAAKYEFKEIIGKAGLNTILGMGTVFAVLIFLAFLIYLLKFIPVVLNLSTTEEKKEVTAIPVVTETVHETVTETVDVTDDLELIAVITAAIAAAEGKNSDGFIVRSIKRRPSNKWN